MKDSIVLFHHIAETLIKGYREVYSIRPYTGEYCRYRINAEADSVDQLIEKAGEGQDFYKVISLALKGRVMEEDRQSVQDFLSRENLQKHLKERTSSHVVYRGIVDRKKNYHSLRLCPILDEEDSLVLAVMDVNNAILRINKQAELERENRIYNQISQSMADHFDTLYYVNMETDEFIEFSSEDFYHSRAIPAGGKDFFQAVKRNVGQMIFPEDQSMMLRVFQKENIIRQLKKRKRYNVNYRLVVNGEPRYTRLVMMWATDELHLIICVEDIHEEITLIKEKNELQKKSFTYGQIVGSLAARYSSILYVDVDRRTYTEYDASDKQGENLKTLREGDDFFRDCEETIRKYVVPEDRKLVKEAIQADKLNEIWLSGEVVSVTFRCMNGSSVIYMKARVAWASDGEHLIIGFTDEDSQIRKEKEQQQALLIATEQAEKDGLTGVKNVTAYQKYEAEFETDIEANNPVPFAIVICDLNGLKQINDTMGHKIGDQYIIDACTLICHTFQHSPVFRIGGDEFCVILKGDDYRNREDLVDEFKIKVASNMRCDRAVVAIGISDFCPGQDTRVRDVFDRADEKMYLNKSELKQILAE